MSREYQAESPGPLFATSDAHRVFGGRHEDAFWRFHEENPSVYGLFNRFTMEALGAGRERFGARMVWERMRWYLHFETTDTDFKLNDHYIAYYARLWMSRNPEFHDFFETRELQA